MLKQEVRKSNLELLRVFCIIFIIGEHFTGQSGIAEGGSIGINFFYAVVTSLSRVSCSVFIIISAWFLVDRDFKFKKIIHVWLTVIMYTVPIMIYLYMIGVASRKNIVQAFLPIEQSPLWFAGYYIVLVLISPLLNLLVKNAPRNIVELFLVVMFCIQCLYTTVTTELGFFSNDIWSLIFLYVLTGYIKVYIAKIPEARQAFSLFGAIWLALTLLRAVAANYGMSILSTYCETYRARFQTLPNLLMAYSIFFAFNGLKLKNSRLINMFASATLGVYCFHQVPMWYTYLWEHGFHSTFYSQTLHGTKRMFYTIFSILLVWIVGTLIELLRAKTSALIIEDRKFCINFCDKVDAWINGYDSGEDRKQNWRTLVSIVGILTVYFLLLHVYSVGGFDFISHKETLSSNYDITDQLNIGISYRDIIYENGTVKCTIIVTNNGKAIADLSSGKYPINLGISVLDHEKNILEQDYFHTVIKQGVFENNENIELTLVLENLEVLEETKGVLRFEIVQEGMAWIENTAIYWDYE